MRRRNVESGCAVPRGKPANGANGRERAAFLDRAASRDIGFCLALIHHLHITHHLSFSQVSFLLSRLCKKLVIEFVPASDPKVKEMLERRENIFAGYTKENFEKKAADAAA